MKTFNLTALLIGSLLLGLVLGDTPPEARADWLKPQKRTGFLGGCDCSVSGVCTCGPTCDCPACLKTGTSSWGQTVQFRKDAAGKWCPVGDGWVKDGDGWTRITPTPSPDPFAGQMQSAPTYYQPMFFSGGFGGGFGGGGCSGG